MRVLEERVDGGLLGHFSAFDIRFLRNLCLLRSMWVALEL